MDRLRTERLLVLESDPYRFEKHPTGNIVSVFLCKNGSCVEIDVFTNYDILDDWDCYQEAAVSFLVEYESNPQNK